MAFDNLSISFTGDADDAIGTVEAVKSSLRSAGRGADSMSDSAEEAGDSLTGLASSGGIVSTALQGLKNRADEAEDEVDSLGRSASTTSLSMAGLSGSVTTVAGSMSALGLVLAPVVTALGGMAAAAGSVAAAFGSIVGVTVATHMEELKQAFKPVKENIMAVATAWSDQFLPLLLDGVAALDDLVANMFAATGSMQPFVGALRELGGIAGDVLPDITAAMFDVARGALPVVMDALRSLREVGPATFRGIREITVELLPELESLTEAVVDLTPTVLAVGTVLADGLLPYVTEFIEITDDVLEGLGSFREEAEGLTELIGVEFNEAVAGSIAALVGVTTVLPTVIGGLTSAASVIGTVAGAAITRTDPSTPVSELATGTFAATVLASIPEDEAVRDSIAVGEPLSTYAPTSPAAAAYRELTAELTDTTPEAPSDSESTATAPGSIADADSVDAESADTVTTADTSTGETAAIDANPPPAASDIDQTDADSDELPEAESKWAEAATGTGIDVDEQLTDETAAMSDDAESTTTTEAADSSEEPSVDTADTDDDGDDTEPAAADTDDDGVTPEPTTETITETATDTSSPIADVAEGITPDPTADGTDFADTGSTPDSEAATEADPAEEAIPFHDADTGDDAADTTAESDAPKPQTTPSDEPAVDASNEPAAEEPLIPDAEGESPSTTDEPSAMTTELGAATDDAAGDTETSDGDDEKKGFFRRLFFG